MADEKKAKKQAAKKASGEQAASKRGSSKGAKKASAEKSSTTSGAKAAGGKAKASEKPTAKAAKPAGKSRGRKSGAAAEKSTAKKPAKAAPILVRATSRYVRVAPRKARLVADQVRGLHIDKARALLQFSPRGAAHDIHKLINSAASNAENNHDLIADEMRVAEITVDEGPTLRRYRPRAKGRATPINKRTSHIAVALSPEERA